MASTAEELIAKWRHQATSTVPIIADVLKACADQLEVVISASPVRVLRVIEYIGNRIDVERQVAKSIHGSRFPNSGIVINAATLGTYPEIMLKKEEV